VAAISHELLVSQVDLVTPPFRIHDSILRGKSINRSLCTLTIVSVASNALTLSVAHDAL
jgi:hypothetical protein